MMISAACVRKITRAAFISELIRLTIRAEVIMGLFDEMDRLKGCTCATACTLADAWLCAREKKLIGTCQCASHKVIPARARRKDPKTSHLAAEALNKSGHLSELQLRVFKWIVLHDLCMDEDIELAEEFTSGRMAGFSNLAYSTVRKRRKDVLDMGLICDSGRTGTNKRGRKMIRWTLTEKGRALAKELAL